MSRDTQHVDLLIPWLANGTLDEAERADVERHLAGCARCRERLRQERNMLTLASLGATGSETEHVSPQLLTRYAERPESLDLDTLMRIEERLDGCEDCRAALAVLRELDEGTLTEAVDGLEPATPTTSGGIARWWQALAASVLRPAPALAYLVLLVLALPALWLVKPWQGGDEAMLQAPVVLQTGGERVTRSGEAPPEPLLVRAVGGAPVLLVLETDFDRDLLADPRLSFELALERDGRTVWSEPRPNAEFGWKDGRATLSVILQTQALEGRGLHSLVIRAARPGDPLDGQALFRRSLIVE